MTMKKFDLAKNLGLKVAGQMKAAGVPGRFAQGAGEVLDKREQRKRDAAAGLVPFACKLPGELNQRLQALAPSHAGGINGLMVDLLMRALETPADDVSTPVVKAPRKAATKAEPAPASAKNPAAKKPAAKKPVSRTP